MLYDKYNREKFYDKVTINGIESFDLSSNKLNDFKFNREKQFYTIIEQDIGRPDIISYKLFGTISFYWIILKMNNIVDPFSELQIGDVIQVPNSLDIDDFIASAKGN